MHFGNKPEQMGRRPTTYRLLVAVGFAAAILVGVAAIHSFRNSLYFFHLVLLVGVAWAIGAGVFFRGKVRDLSVLAVTLCVSLMAVESIALLYESTPRTRNYGRYVQDYIGFNPTLGAAPASAGVFDSRKLDQRTSEVIYDVSYTIDDNLIRMTESAESGPVVGFFGDSFMFGEGVGDSETLPQIFADLAGGKLRVLNFGFHGYGPQQFLRALETGLFDQLMRPDLRLLVFQTAPWHAERTSCRADFVASSPRYELRDGDVVFAGACTVAAWNVLFKQFEKSAAYRLLVQPILSGGPDRADMELYIAVVSRAVREAQSRYGVPTVILYLGYNDQYLQRSGLSNEEIVARFRSAGAHLIDATLTAEDGRPLTRYDVPSPLIIAKDGHPTALAQRLRAELLFEYLLEQFPGLITARQPNLLGNQSSSKALR